MRSRTRAVPVSLGTPWGGCLMSGLPALLIAIDDVMKRVAPAPVTESMREPGYPERLTGGWASSCLPAGPSTSIRARPPSARSC